MSRTSNHIASRVDRTRIHQTRMVSGEIVPFSVDFTSPLATDNINSATWRVTGGVITNQTTTNKITSVKFQAQAGNYAVDVLATTEQGNKLRQSFYVTVVDSGFSDAISGSSDTLTTDPLTGYLSPSSLSATNVPFDNNWQNIGAPITVNYSGGVGGWSFIWTPTIGLGEVRAVAQNTEGTVVQIQGKYNAEASTNGLVSVTVRDDGGNQVLISGALSIAFGNPA